MHTLTYSAARRGGLDDAMNRATYKGEIVVITRRGLPDVGLVPAEIFTDPEAFEDWVTGTRGELEVRRAQETGELHTFDEIEAEIAAEEAAAKAGAAK